MSWVMCVVIAACCFSLGYCLGLDRVARTVQMVYNALLVLLFEKLDDEMCKDLVDEED